MPPRPARHLLALLLTPWLASAYTLLVDRPDDPLALLLGQAPTSLTAAACWAEPRRLGDLTGDLVLSGRPTADWPVDLLTRRAKALAALVGDRLVVLLPPGDDPRAAPWRLACLRDDVPELAVLATDDLPDDAATFAALAARAQAARAAARSLICEGRTGGGPARLLVRSNLPRAGRWRLAAIAPAGLFGGDERVVELPARGTASVAVSPPEDGGCWLIAVGLEGDTAATPLRVAVAEHGLYAQFEPGRQITHGSAQLPLRLRAADRQRLVARVRPGPGFPLLTARLSGSRDERLLVPVAAPTAGFARLTSTVEAAVGATLVPWRTQVTAVPTVWAARRPIQLDGRLDEWRSAAWQSCEDPQQVVAGAASWRGPADAGLRWSVARDAESLYVACLVTDAQATAADAVELRWDPDVTAEAEPGAMVRRLVIDRAAAAGELASGWWCELAVSLAALGVAAAGDDWLGFDLALRDDDPGEPPTWLSYTGELWSEIDAARLGLLRLGDVPSPSVRWWVGDCGWAAAATGN